MKSPLPTFFRVLDYTIIDETGKIVTTYGNVHLDISEKKFGSASCSFVKATGDYLTVPTSDDFEFGTGDFTIDWWEYRTIATQTSSIVRAPNMLYCGFLFGYSWLSNNNYIYMGSDNLNWDICEGRSFGAAILDTWEHYAVVRTGNTFYAFKNGIQADTWTSSLAIATTSNPFSIGCYNISGKLTGYMDELRVSKGIARWTANFTPPTNRYSVDSYTKLLMHFNVH